MSRIFTLIIGVVFSALTSLFAQEVINFEELNLSPESYWNGSDMSGSFTSKYMTFFNNYTDWGGGMYSWDGFAYSNVTDNTTPGYLNQYSAAAGSGNNNSANYAVAYVSSDWMNNYQPIPISIKIDKNQMGENFPGMYVSLNTYASLYMDEDNLYLNGKHWFKIIINAVNSATNFSANREILLADYRFENNTPLKLNQWTYINMEWAAPADSLSFILATSDTGDWGPNTPTYFCIDDIAATEPSNIPQLIAEIPNQYVIAPGESVQLLALVKGGVQPYSFQWSNEPGLDNYNSQNPIATPQQTTTYTVTVSDASGNLIVENVNVNVTSTHIANVKDRDIMISYKDQLEISAYNTIGKAIIYDLTGKKIMETYFNNNFAQITISDFSEGIYIVSLPEHNYTTKIMK